MNKIVFIIICLVTLNSYAIEKCELPLYYLNEAAHELVNQNQEDAKKNFTLGFDLHTKLQEECGTDEYLNAISFYIEQYANQN